MRRAYSRDHEECLTCKGDEAYSYWSTRFQLLLSIRMQVEREAEFSAVGQLFVMQAVSSGWASNKWKANDEQ